MPSDEEFRELKDQVASLSSALATARRRIDDLEDGMADHLNLDWGTSLVDVNSPHPNLSIDTGEFGGARSRLDQFGRQVKVGAAVGSKYFYDFLVSEFASTAPADNLPLLAAGAYTSSTEEQWDMNAYLTAGDYGRVFVFADNTPSQRAGAEAVRASTVAQVFANIGDTDDGHVKIKPALLFEKVASRPTGLAAGGVWAGTDNKLYFYDGTSDVDLGGGGSMPMPPLVGTENWHSLGMQLSSNAAAAPVSATWPAANRALYIPLVVTEDITVTKLWWMNGATASGNVNMCLYTSAFAQVANTETGSTAQAGTNVIQEVDITNTAITAGLYYMALVMDNTTGTMFRYNNGARFLQSWGMAEEASVFDLPSTATPADVSTAFAPLCGIATRTQVA